jgi:2,3-bisphosphoglycerate-independent phosphoglycerate mutase
MKYVVIVVDGMADEPVAELNGRTPLEQANTETLDQMAARGILGLTRTIPRGLPPGCTVGTLSVLGYDPQRYYTGRAGVEAVGLDVPLGPKDVAFVSNLVTLETPAGGVEVMRDFAGGHPSPAECRELVLDLGRALGREGIELHPGAGYRHLVVWRNGEMRMRTYPPHDLTGKPVAASFPDGPGSDVLRDLMGRSRAVLAEHPICQARLARGERAPTAIWIWGQGTVPVLPSLGSRYGVQGAFVATTPLCAGLAQLAGLARVPVPPPSGLLDVDLRAVASHALEALAARDFVLVHVDAPAECACNGDAPRKVDAIERIDTELVAPLVDGLRQRGEEWRLLLVPDHATPCSLRTDTGEPVPFVVAVSGDEGRPPTLTRRFSEKDARDNGIFIAEAHALLERLLRHS